MDDATALDLVTATIKDAQRDHRDPQGMAAVAITAYQKYLLSDVAIERVVAALHKTPVEHAQIIGALRAAMDLSEP